MEANRQKKAKKAKKRKTTHGSINMEMFKCNYKLPELPHEKFAPIDPPVIDNVEYLKYKNATSANSLAVTSIAMLNVEKESIQKCAYYLSALTNFIPTLYPVAKDVLEFKGYGICTVDEVMAKDTGIKLEKPIQADKLAAMIGQLILILFKNINERGYERYMKARASAIKARAGYYGKLVKDEDGDVILSCETAEVISKMLGSNNKLRSNILHAVISNASSEGSFGNICGYIKGVTEWTGMSAIKLIQDTLLVRKAKILKHPLLSIEMLNIQEAFVEINKSEYPQYYKVFNPTSATRILDKCRFPNLTEIAKRIKANEQLSMNNYVGTVSYDQAFVNKMVKQFYKDEDKDMKLKKQKGFDYLTNFERHPELETSSSESEDEDE